jgi:hypothetical protein
MVGAAAKPSATPPPPAGKPRPNPPQREAGETAPRRPGPPALFVRITITVVLLWHLAAVFLAPMSVPPSSPLVVTIAQGWPMQWYLDAMYLNHGYYFFAPEPGDGHLIYYDIYDAQGNPLKQGKFPDWDLHWPRLWYHRQFMLADQVGGGIPHEHWQRRFLEAFGRQLLRQFGGESVRVRWIAHSPPDPRTLTDPAKLDVPESYKLRLPEVIQRRSDLGPEAQSQSDTSQVRQPAVANRWIGVSR